MRLTVFGGSGRTGRILIDRALAAGHSVTAYVRSGVEPPPRESLRVLVGELADAAAVSRAVEGADAVISTLGPDARVRGVPLGEGMDVIVAAMKEQGVRRLVAVSTPSHRDPRDGFALDVRLVVAAVRVFLHAAWLNEVDLSAAVAASGLDWTLVRVPLLSNGPDAGAPRVGYPGEPGIRMWFLPRETLAAFLLAQATGPGLLRQAPMVCAARNRARAAYAGTRHPTDPSG